MKLVLTVKNKNIPLILWAFGLLITPLSVAQAGDIPPPGSKLLSAVIQSVEHQKLGVISEVEFDDSLWEVKVCDVGACHKLYIDPRSGMEKRRRTTGPDDMPPAGAMPLSTIVQSVEARGLGNITEVEFDDGFWEAKLRKDGRKSKLVLDPRTGATR